MEKLEGTFSPFGNKPFIIAGIFHRTPPCEPRTDGRYPQRVGSTVNIVYLEIDACCSFDYLMDNKGNEKQGRLITSLVIEYSCMNDKVIIKTLNTIYVLKEAV